MREFVIVAHDAPLTPEFPLEDLPGAAGRLDVLCRCVTAGLLTSHGVRENVGISVVIRDELTVRFDGGTIRQLQPDERSTAARFRSALEAAENAVGLQPVDVSPGVSVSRRDLAATLEEHGTEEVVLLHEDGDPIVDRAPPSSPTFVLSDHRSFGDDELGTIRATADDVRRLGPVAIHADQAITVAHNYLDTEGYREY